MARIFPQKRFYSRGTLRSTRISRLVIISKFIVVSWDPWITKTVNRVGWKGRRVWKKFTVVQKMPRYLLIRYKISFLSPVFFSSLLSLQTNENSSIFQFLFISWNANLSKAGFGSVTFYPADLDYLNTDQPENAIKLKMSKW